MSSTTRAAKKEWRNRFKGPKKTNQTRIPYPFKPSLKRNGKRKTFPDLQGLRKLIIHELLLKEILNYILQPSGKKRKGMQGTMVSNYSSKIGWNIWSIDSFLKNYKQIRKVGVDD